ncbi:MAG: hypothetical protein L0Y74_11460 [candidate division Zixibacteria bacterium]|nr:hypothetical protein [candidate division Zixibacteria bacterium]
MTKKVGGISNYPIFQIIKHGWTVVRNIKGQFARFGNLKADLRIDCRKFPVREIDLVWFGIQMTALFSELETNRILEFASQPQIPDQLKMRSPSSVWNHKQAAEERKIH